MDNQEPPPNPTNPAEEKASLIAQTREMLDAWERNEWPIANFIAYTAWLLDQLSKHVSAPPASPDA